MKFFVLGVCFMFIASTCKKESKEKVYFELRQANFKAGQNMHFHVHLFDLKDIDKIVYTDSIVTFLHPLDDSTLVIGFQSDDSNCRYIDLPNDIRGGDYILKGFAIKDGRIFENSRRDTIIFIEEVPISERAYYFVEKMPEFPGGEIELLKYILKNVKLQSNEELFTGKVYVRFIIDENGYVTNPEILRGINKSVDNEVIRVVNSLPKWKPGENRGKRVKVWYTIPISIHFE